MRGPRRDEITARLQADNVAPEPEDAFIATLSTLAAASRREVPRTRARRSTARLTVAAVGTGLLLSGGAVASAFALIGGPAHDPGRDPAHPAPTSGSSASTPASIVDDNDRSGGSDDASAGGSDDASAGGPTSAGPTIAPPGQTTDHALPEPADEHADEQMPPAENHRRDGDHRAPGAGDEPPTDSLPTAAENSRTPHAIDAAPGVPGHRTPR